MAFLEDFLKEGSDNFSKIKKIANEIKRTSTWMYVAFCSTVLGFFIIAGCFIYAFSPVIVALFTAPLSPLPGPYPMQGPLQNILLIGMLVAMGPIMIVMVFFSIGNFFHPRPSQFVERDTPRQSSSGPIYNISGNNPKVNVNSIDYSTSIVGDVDMNQFIQIEAALDQISDLDKRRECKKSLQDLKDSIGTESYVSKYQRFISTASDHMTLILPFIQFLSGFLKS